MSNKFSSKWEFSKFMSYHVFSNEDRSMNFSIVDTESVTNKFWSNCTWSWPCLDHSLLSWLIKSFNFLYKASVYIRSFFKTTCHSVDGLDEVKCVVIGEIYLSEKFSSTSSYYPSISCCSTSSFYTTSRLTPRGFRSISLSKWLMSFSTSMWVIHSIHGHTKNCRSDTHPSWTSRFTYNNLIMIHIGNNSNSRVTFLMHSSNLARR